MKKIIGAVILLLMMNSALGYAQQYKPFTSFRVIKTEYFDIIFPKESEPSARLLASYADRIYEQVSSLLGIEVPVRIPVTFVPHTDMLNGHYMPIPSPHIVLFDTQNDPEKLSFSDNLEALFLHELTHAVSLNTRGPFMRGLRSVFGSWATLIAFNSPPFMTEGITVSFESLSGFGRANDPRVKQYLRQAIYEDAFLTPVQASGLFDRPIHETYYEYGGLFSAWLQKKYGMEKYAELWQAMGRRFRFSFIVYRSDYYHIFKNVYRMEFKDAWNAFRKSLALDGIEENEGEVLQKKYHYFSEKNSFLRCLTASENKLYFISEGKVNKYDTLTGDLDAFNAESLYIYDLDVSANTVLVSGYRYIGDRFIATVTEQNAHSGATTGRTLNGLYKARYFRDGVVGLRSDLHKGYMVYESFDGKSEVLFQGSEGISFSGPQVIDDERLAFTVSRNGVRELWLYHYTSQELYKIENSDGDNQYWPYMRNLGVSDGKLFFSHNADDRMYKLARVDLETMQAVFSERDFSGGVFNPVSANGDIYYLGAFTFRDGLLRFPENNASLSGSQSQIKLVRLDAQNYQAISKLETSKAQAAALNTEECATANEQSESPYTGPSKNYFGLRYMHPFQCWLPLPLLRIKYDIQNIPAGISLDGGGLLSVLMDPTENNFITLIAYADIPYKMAMIDQFSWKNTALGFPLTLNFSDSVIGFAKNSYRSTIVTLTGSLNWSFGRWSFQFFAGTGYSRIASYQNGKGAYLWDKIDDGFLIATGFSLSNRNLSMEIGGITFVDSFEPRIDGIIEAMADTSFPLRLTLFGAYDKQGMHLNGKSESYGERYVEAYALGEYEHPAGLTLEWLAGCEAGMNLFSLEIQRNIFHIYFKRLMGYLAIRNEIYDSKGNPAAEGLPIKDLRLIQSLMLKLTLKTAYFPIVQIPIPIEPYIFGIWKFSNAITGNVNQWYWNGGLGLGVSISY